MINENKMKMIPQIFALVIPAKSFSQNPEVLQSVTRYEFNNNGTIFNTYDYDQRCRD